MQKKPRNDKEIKIIQILNKQCKAIQIIIH